MIVLCLTSCRRMDLYVATSSVFLKIDTDRSSGIPEGYIASGNRYVDLSADTLIQDKLNGPEIGAYYVCLYDVDSHVRVMETFVPYEGGFLDVPSGTYDIIVYSAGSDITVIRNTESRGNTLATTTEYATGAALHVPEPGQIFSTGIESVFIPLHSDSDTTHVVNITTTKVLESYYVSIPVSGGIDRIYDVEMHVSGQLQGRYLWDRRTYEQPCQIQLKPILDVEKGMIHAVFNTFGRYTREITDVNLAVIVTNSDGVRFQWIYNITEEFDSPDNTDHLLLMEEGIIIPDTSDGGGFSPDVNDWDENEHYIPIT